MNLGQDFLVGAACGLLLAGVLAVAWTWGSRRHDGGSSPAKNLGHAVSCGCPECEIVRKKESMASWDPVFMDPRKRTP